VLGMAQLKVDIEKFVVENKEELVSNYLAKVCTKFKSQLLDLHDARKGYDEIISFILSLKYKYIV
jgi:hypothetical protein